MNLKTSRLSLFISLIILGLCSCSNKICDEIEKDYDNLKQEIEMNSGSFNLETINLFYAENSFYDKYKHDELYNIIKNYSDSNIGCCGIRCVARTASQPDTSVSGNG